MHPIRSPGGSCGRRVCFLPRVNSSRLVGASEVKVVARVHALPPREISAGLIASKPQELQLLRSGNACMSKVAKPDILTSSNVSLPSLSESDTPVSQTNNAWNFADGFFRS
jgi:hypothetical protein